MSEKLDMTSPDLVNNNFEKLAQLFPNCVTESATGKAIDFDLLKQELSHDIIEGNKERYRLEWPGKREAIVTANLPTTKTLRPIREDSVDFDTTENLYIEGDNLEVLKLLQESYLGKIKMIYIDPPYNTGKDFVYKDNFTEDKTEHEQESGQRDEYGRRLVPNPESSGRYHSDWLTMMYPRLKLARNLLTDDGAIFISIDRHEYHNLRRLCDDVFGQSNFVSDIVWKKKTGAGKSIKHIFDEHEYVLVYSRNKELAHNWRIESDDDGNFKNPDDDSRGNWESCAFTAPSKNKNENQLYIIEVQHNSSIDNNPKSHKGRTLYESFNYGDCFIKIYSSIESEGIDLVDVSNDKSTIRFLRRWAYAKDNIKKMFDDNRVYINGTNIPRYKKFEYEYDGKALKSFYSSEFSTQQGTDGFKSLFGNSYLEYPKSVLLMKHLQNALLQEKDLILDFFSGSASSAEATLRLNKDGINRKYIMVQIPELTDENSDAYKAGFKNICEIGKERIRRAAKKIKEETKADIDYGFRVYRLDESNMQDVYYKPQDYDQGQLDAFSDNVKPDRSSDDLLAQILLDWGLPLSLPIEQVSIAGKHVFKVASNSLYACFDTGIDEAFAKAVAQEKPLRIVFKDNGFKNDTAKENVKQLLKQLSPDTEMKVL